MCTKQILTLLLTLEVDLKLAAIWIAVDVVGKHLVDFVILDGFVLGDTELQVCYVTLQSDIFIIIFSHISQQTDI